MIYIVEDDNSIRELVAYTLNTTGLKAKGFEEGEAFFSALKKELPDLVLLDIMLPGEDGISILEKLRSDTRTRNIPVIMVTAKGTEYDKVFGLNHGADDYLAKPFGMMELVARINALFRRTGKDTVSKHLSLADITIDREKHQVMANGQEILLTYKEFELLCLLLEHPGIVLTRNQILTTIWGYDFDGETRTVDVHIRTLRQKLGNSGDKIKTIRGIGYRIDLES